MRRCAAILALLILIVPIWASPGSVLDAYLPFYQRNMSMGGTGTASSRYSEILYSNPALIGSDNQYFSVPSFSLTLYNINKLIQPGGALDIFLTQNNGEEDLNRAFNQLINSIGSGSGDVLSAELSFGFISGIMGLSLDGSLDFHSMGSGGESSTIIMEGNIAFSLGLSLPLTVGENHTFSFGAAVHLVLRGFTVDDITGDIQPGGITASSLIDFYSRDDVWAGLLNQLPVAFGFAIPVDLGFTYDYRDIFTFGLALKNLNGTYRMQSYSAVNQLYYMLTGGYIGDTVPGNPRQGDSFQFHSGLSLDAGIALRTPSGGGWDWAGLTLAADLTDLLGFFSEPVTSSTLVTHLRLGAQLSLVNTFHIRAGINSGYLSLGFTFDFQIFTVDLTYATLEYGQEPGDKPLDLFSVCIRLGLEN